MTAKRLIAVLLLTIVGASLSGVLLFQHHGDKRAARLMEPVCGPEGSSGCDAVNRSQYAEVRGIPLAALGILFYVSLALLLVLSLQTGAEARGTGAALALLALGVALAVDLVLLGVQAFAIHAYCKMCLLTYAVNAAAIILLWPARSAFAGLARWSSAVEARLLLTGWVLGSLALVGAVYGGETLLTARESSGTVDSDAHIERMTAEQARQEVRRLKEILDDPQRLEQYFADKAIKEFDEAPAQSFDVSGAPVKGPAQAAIQIMEFSDFLCPYCRMLAQGLGEFVPQARGRLSVYFKHFPLDQTCNPKASRTVHPGACFLARASICAHDQGRFWAYHDKVFGTDLQQKAEMEDALRLAREAGLDTAALRRCMDSPSTQERLIRDVNEADRAGISGTPAVFVSGKRLARFNHLPLIVEKEAARLGLPAPAQRAAHP